MARSVLYLHGFASSPDGIKAQNLRTRLGAEGIAFHAPDLNAPSFEKLSFEAMVARAMEAARDHPPEAIVGSSLGCLVALEVVRRGVDAPLILIAPAINVGELWTSRLPEEGDPLEVWHYGMEREAPIHRAFFEEISRVHPDRETPLVRVTIFMGRDDESIPFERVRERWTQWEQSGRLTGGSRFIEVSGGDHRLIGQLDRIAETILTQ